jgi:hypothetical protein
MMRDACCVMRDGKRHQPNENTSECFVRFSHVEIGTEVDFACFGIVRKKLGGSLDQYLAFVNDVAAVNKL